MDDRLLTIEDATREHRVGPRTIRRRLSAGRVDEGYKGASGRGPEWVVPQASLEALGLDRRDETGPVQQLRRSSSVLLDLADGSRSFLVFDTSGASGDEPRDGGGQTDAGEDAMAPAPLAQEQVAVTELAPTPPAVVALQAAVASPATVTLAEGDSFWSVAVDLATAATAGRTLTEAEVVSVWASMVDANRDRLVEPGNPDLLLVGQTLDVGPAR